MKILFLNAYFYPEVISFTHLEKDLMEKMIAEGLKVDYRWVDAGWYSAPDGSSPMPFVIGSQ